MTVSTLTGENGTIDKTGEAKALTELSGTKEQIELEMIGNPIKYMNTEQCKEKFPIISNKYKNNIGIYREELIYLANESSIEAQNAKKVGFNIINMNTEEFKYYIELGKLEDSAIEHKKFPIGRELNTYEFADSINIGDVTYGIGWFLIGNYTQEEKDSKTYNSQYEKLGLEDTSHSPYIANYNTGEVLSVDGMVMYKAEIQVHSFNSTSNRLANAITYVDDKTKKTGTHYGNLYSTSLYTGDINDDWANYTDNNGLLEYDQNGALILDANNAIPVLEVNQKYKIDDEYSISMTIEGNIYQTGDDKFANAIVALSDTGNYYISWIGIYKGYLHVYSFKGGSEQDVNQETSLKGFTSIDISKYEGKAMNIQVVAERSETTKVYINGELVKTFQSGDEQLTYNYTTIGDLRVGRNLKFIGKMYDFALFGAELGENDVQEIWQSSKKYVK